MSDGISFSWQTVERVIVGAIVLFITTVLTIARPWLARMLIKTLRDSKAEYRELSREVNQDAFAQLEEASNNAREALRLVTQMKERMERLESASDEQGKSLAELHTVPSVLERVEGMLMSCLNGLGDMRSSFARLDERTTQRNTHSRR